MAGTAKSISSLPAFPGTKAGGRRNQQQPGIRQQNGNPVVGVQPPTKAGGLGNTTVAGTNS